MSINFQDKQAEKSKATPPSTKLDPPKSDQSETLDKVNKDRKKRWQKKKQESKETNIEDNTLATGRNAIASKKKKSGQNRGPNQGQNRSQQDLS